MLLDIEAGEHEVRHCLPAAEVHVRRQWRGVTARECGEVARRTGLPTSTLRYYERIGLLPAPGRTDSGGNPAFHAFWSIEEGTVTPVAERRAFANQQVFVTVMFETASAFDHLDEIAAMDGIDALTLGPADLAQDLGVFGTPDQARVLDAKRDLILAAARKHGKTCSMLVSSAEQARQWKEAGALLLVYWSDAEMLHHGFSQAMTKIRGG